MTRLWPADLAPSYSGPIVSESAVFVTERIPLPFEAAKKGTVIARGHPSRHSSFAQFAVQGDHDLGFLVDSLEANTIYTRVARKGTTVVTSPLDLFNDITDENVRGVWSPPPTSDDPSTAQASSAGIGIAWLNKNSW